MKIIETNKKFFIIILVNMLLFSTHISYARYIQTENLNIVQDIAIPILEIEEGKIIKINEENNIGFYEFSIKNFNKTNVSEISFLYTIEIVSNFEDYLQFELYDEEKQVILHNSKTEPILINANERVEKNYKIKIIYINIDKVRLDKKEDIQIKVKAEQEKI